jgi:hypothetical protein
MKFKTQLILLVTMILSLAVGVVAQSEDIDSPTPVTGNMISGEGDGKAQTIYYSFTATPGDLKVTVDAKTDHYSTPVVVSLLDEDGKELLQVYTVAAGAGQREVKSRRFVREQKVIVKIALREDAQVKLVTYKIKLDGAMQGGTTVSSAPPDTSMSSGTTADSSASITPEASASVSSSNSMKMSANKSLGLAISNLLGEKLNLPTNGKLRIEMKDGSIQEIDLVNVKKILVKQ